MLVKLLPLICSLLVIVTTNAAHNSTTRIVGGSTAYEGQFPYQVSVRYQDLHNCGGSIITRSFILTAAHCVGEWTQGEFEQYAAKHLSIRAGSIDRLRGGVLINVDTIKTHEDYGDFLYDIALLKLSNPLIYSKNIQPIPLASRNTPVGTPVIVSGWGYTKQGGDAPRLLQWNTLTSISSIECKDSIVFDSETLLCLGHARDNGICGGDSGGPAVWNGEIVGVANFIYYACGSWYPDVFANVYFHVKWIRKNSDL